MKKILLSFIFLTVSIAAWAGPFVSQKNWRWRANSGTETNATWLAAENTTITISNFDPIRLRIELDNNDPSANIDLKSPLFYSTSTSGPWTKIDLSTANAFSMISLSAIPHGSATTKQLTGASSNTFVAGKMITSDTELLQSMSPLTKTEYEWSIQPNSSILQNTTYYFKSDAGDVVGTPSLTTSATLPVTLDKFEAKVSGNRVKLDWSTLSERNNEKFEIQKSADGVKWNYLAAVDGSGTSNSRKDYTAYDFSPSSLNYYKLNQVDYNGSPVEIGLKVVRFSLDVNDQISIYPNPVVAKFVNVNLLEATNSDWKITLSDLSGKLIKTEEGKKIGLTYQFALPENLANGIYLINFKSGEINQSKKVVVKR